MIAVSRRIQIQHSTFTARKLPVEDNGVFTGFSPHVTSLTDYYPFGSGMEGRTVTEGYRYGFNAMEREDDLYAPGSAYDFGARMYDGRLGRWWSVDFNQDSYPFSSPYAFALNTPLFLIDYDGNDVDLSRITTLYHSLALQVLAESPAFLASIKRYMKAGQSVSLPGTTLTIYADVDGDRANDLLQIVTSHELSEGFNGVTISRLKGNSKRVHESHPKTDGTTIEHGVATTVYLDVDIKTLDEAIRVLGHEQMVHADQDADRLSEIDRLSESGSLTMEGYQKRKREIAVDGVADHAKLKSGGISRMKRVFDEIGRPDLYEKDKKEVRNYGLH